MDALKKAAALTAVDLIVDNTVVGLGSGSTLVYFIEELGARIQQGKLHITGVPTSYQARMIAKASGIPLLDPMDVESLDITVDGADEVDPVGNLIKGAGGAHVIEKLVAALAKRFVVVVDESKQVQRLGEHVAIPVEVIAPALSFAQRRLRELGGTPVVRNGNGKVGPVISDIGHPIIDVRFAMIADPVWLDQQINGIPGVLGHGLFVGMADQVIIARPPLEHPRIEIQEF
ncbi:MAG: ribose-5-phosphate isomerase RpiA [Candidatus Binatia bacterium]